MSHYTSFRRQFLICFVMFIQLYSCEKQFDSPPTDMETAFAPDLSIKDLRAKHTMGKFEQLTEAKTIVGVVVADDASDNFYKSIVIQDTTGGITIRMDGIKLNANYPVGRKLAINVKGLWLGDYGKMIQLGAGVDNSDPASPSLLSIPQTLFDQYIRKGEMVQELTPVKISISQLTNSYQSMLIQLEQVEFVPSDTGKTYADASNKQSLNRTLRACNANNIILRSSGYANFANIKTPPGNGTIVGIYSVYGTTKQLLIRDTSDMHFTQARCGSGSGIILLNENFESANVNTDLALAGWKNIIETGGKAYQAKTSSGNKYAEITAFGSNQKQVTSWLIAPPIDLNVASNETLSFKTRDGYDNGAVLRAMISFNYDGGNTPWSASWTPLNGTISKGTSSGYNSNWVSSGNISLAGYSGMATLAFRYEGNDPATTSSKHNTTFQIDDVKLVGN